MRFVDRTPLRFGLGSSTATITAGAILAWLHQFSLAAFSPLASKSLEIISVFHLLLHHDQVIAKGRNIFLPFNKFLLFDIL